MPKLTRLTLPSIALAATLCGCALSPVTGGMDTMQVEARMGKPETVRKNTDGSETWEYPGGPLGRQTYMVTLSADHTVREVRQVLREEYFSRVQAGMSRDQVRQLLGKPAETSVFPARDEEVWSWRYQEQNPMFFNVMFDRSSGTVRSTQTMQELLYLDTDC